MEKETIIELKNIRKEFPGVVALDNVNMKIRASEVHALVGENGAGKSTLMNLITQNLEPDEGEILINGISTAKMGASYRDVLGYMPQQQGLYDRFSALEFLRYFAALKGLKAKESRKRIEELLEVVNLTEARNRKLGGFSGGMKQRVLLAQALLNEPQILILDEPTAGLDPKERIRIRNLVAKISMDKTVIIATHIVSDIEFIAGNIIMLDKGNIIKAGTPSELLKEIDGRVYEQFIEDSQVDEYNKKYMVSGLMSAANNIKIRFITDGNLEEGAVKVEPNLEDYYLIIEDESK